MTTLNEVNASIVVASCCESFSMRILLCLCLVFVVRLALASEVVYKTLQGKDKGNDEEMKITLQSMNDGNGGDQKSDEEVFGIEPTKHPFKVHYKKKRKLP